MRADDLGAINRTRLVYTEPRLNALLVKNVLTAQLNHLFLFGEFIAANNALVKHSNIGVLWVRFAHNHFFGT